MADEFKTKRFKFQYSKYGGAYLPHSCDEWEIGSKLDLAEFIAEAKQLLAWMEAHDAK